MEIKNIKPEDRLLFTCTRQNFLSTNQETVIDICRNQEINWDVVYATARVHGVAPLVYSNLQRCTAINLGIPRDIVNQFKRSLASNIVRQKRAAEKLTELLSFFNQKSIDVMLVKGAALDILVYDQPWYTTLNDVDLIVGLRKEELPDKDIAEIRATRLGLKGLPSECDFFEHHDVNINGMLPINFQKIWDEATKIKFKGQDVFVMSPEDMLISVCINSGRKRFFRLKALCDIAEIINKYDGMKWEELTSKAREYDCNNIVYTALLATKITVGCKLPAGVLDELAVSPVRATIIHYLSQRMSWSSLASLYSGRKILGRRVSLSLILPYLSYRWYQVGRKIKLVYKKRSPIIEPDVRDLMRISDQ